MDPNDFWDPTHDRRVSEAIWLWVVKLAIAAFWIFFAWVVISAIF